MTKQVTDQIPVILHQIPDACPYILGHPQTLPQLFLTPNPLQAMQVMVLMKTQHLKHLISSLASCLGTKRMLTFPTAVFGMTEKRVGPNLGHIGTLAPGGEQNLSNTWLQRSA